MKTLAIDIETYSSVSLQKSGVYAYAQSDDFEILLFGYAWDDGPVEVIDLTTGQKLPPELQNALYDSKILKTALMRLLKELVYRFILGVLHRLNSGAVLRLWLVSLVYPAA